jgi:hypothetical protein
VVRLDEHGIGDEQVAAEIGQGKGGEPVGGLCPYGAGNQRAGIADDPQCLKSSENSSFR